MKERPILFSGPMVRAILEGRKTQTRRVVKCDLYDIERLATPGEWNDGRAHPKMIPYENWGEKRGCGLFVSTTGTIFAMPCPFGKPGDRLWVREAWETCAIYDSYSPSQIDSGAALLWIADNSKRINGPENWGKIRPSIFMPQWASRITLEITGIRVERLQDITEEDAIAEGVGHGFQMNAGWPDYQHINKSGICELTQDTAWASFSTLWDSIKGKKHPWASNPWVWVINFKDVRRD